MKNTYALFALCFVFAHNSMFAQEIKVLFSTVPPATNKTTELPETLQTFPNRASLTEFIHKQFERFQREGFLEVQTHEKITNNPDEQLVAIEFDLGRQWAQLQISIPVVFKPFVFKLMNSYDFSIPNDQSTTLPSFNVRLSIGQVAGFMDELSQIIAKDYSPFSQIRLMQLEPIAYPVMSARLEANLLAQRMIDSLVVKGYSNIDPGLLKHGAGLKLPISFETNRLKRSEEKLSSSEFVDLERPSEVLFEQDRTTLYMYLQKKEANQIEGILGFGTNPDNQSLQLNGYVNIQLWNNLNKSERFDLQYKADGNQQERLEVSASLPYISASPFGGAASFELFRRDSTFTTATTNTQITYKPYGPVSLALGYTYINSTTGQGAVTTQGSINDFKQQLWSIEITTQKARTSILMPRKYVFGLQAQTGTSSQVGNTNTNTSVNNGTGQRLKFNLDLEYLWDLWPNHYFFVGHKTGWLNGDNLIINEMYRFGGTQSLRGFNENLIETPQMHLTQFEYRLSFSDSFYIHHLSDVALYRNIQNSQMRSNYALGFGIATLTRAGILKLQLAQGFGNQSDFSANNTKIHLVFNSQF